MKLLGVILGIFMSIILIMQFMSLLNKGNIIFNVLGLIGIFLVGFIIAKTKLFTSFKTKK